MTTESQTEEPEVIEETQVETQEVAEETSNENPPEEGEATEANEKEIARANFQKRQQKRNEEVEKLRRENEYLRQLGNTNKPEPIRQQPQSNLPQLENFENEADWIAAVLDARDQQRVAEQEIKAKTQTYAQKLEEYAKVNEDIYAYEQEVVNVIGGDPVIADAIMQSDKAALLVEAIALDPKKADKLKFSRDPYTLARNILALEDSVGEKPTFSDAPPPRKTPKGEPVISTKLDISKMSKAEYFAYRQNQRNKG